MAPLRESREEILYYAMVWQSDMIEAKWENVGMWAGLNGHSAYGPNALWLLKIAILPAVQLLHLLFECEVLALFLKH